MDIETLFFELLQVAIGNRKSLDRMPSAEEWVALFDMAKKQALVAVAFKGVCRLKETDGAEFTQTCQTPLCNSEGSLNHKPYTINLPEMVYLKWLGLTAKIAQRNKVMNEECVRLAELLKHDGFHCCILKGQSNLVYYPEGLRECRTSGDIDVLFRSMEEPFAIDLPVRYCQERARLLGEKPPHVTYHHADLAWDGSTSVGEHGRTTPTTEVEGHYRATFLCSPLRNIRLQHWLEDNMPWGVSDAKIGESVFPVAPISYNAIYQLLHIYKHLFEEGIGLRQLLDYYFVLRALHIEQGEFADHGAEKFTQWCQTPLCKFERQSIGQWAEGMGIGVKSNEEIMHTLSRFGMRKFAGAVMYVLQTVFAMPDVYLICPPNEKEGKFLLNEIMMAGNFGKYDERIKHETPSIPLLRGRKVPGQLWHAIEKTKHNLRLLTHYPEEVIWEPVFRIYHFLWRKLRLWRF